MQIIKGNAKKMVATPFGAHFATRLHGVNSKLVCALSRANVPIGRPWPPIKTCIDDNPPPPPPPPPPPSFDTPW